MNETRFERLTWLLLSFFAYALLFMARGQSCSFASAYPGGVPEARAQATETMHQFIHDTARTLGEEEAVIRSATAVMLRSIQTQMPAADFDLVVRRVSGVRSLLLEPVATEGVATGSDAELPEALRCVGLAADQLDPFTAMFVGFLRREAGERVVLCVCRDVPELDPAG